MDNVLLRIASRLTLDMFGLSVCLSVCPTDHMRYSQTTQSPMKASVCKPDDGTSPCTVPARSLDSHDGEIPQFQL